MLTEQNYKKKSRELLAGIQFIILVLLLRNLKVILERKI